jgi:CRP-like cAMP-binding protein/Fe-S-cluster-containing hydrogenase component 2
MSGIIEPVPIEQLKTYPFFNRLSDGILGKLQPNLAERRFVRGETLLRLGEYSDAAYYLIEGAVEVRVPRITALDATQSSAVAKAAPVSLARRVAAILARPSNRDLVQGRPGPDGAVPLSDIPVDHRPSQRVVLGAGEIFGEIGALSRYPVTADVVADTDARVLMIGTPALRLMMKQRGAEEFKTFVDERYRSRSLATHLRRVELLEGLDNEAIERLRDRAELRSFDPGATIVEQGSTDTSLFLVRGGYVKVSVRSPSGPGSTGLAVSYLRKGDYAGETGLLTAQPWPFSLSAIEHVEVVRISRRDFEAVMPSRPDVEKLLRKAAAERLEQIATVSANPASARHLQMAMDTGLINGQSVLLIDMTTCTGCDDCVRACADTHGGQPRLLRQGAVHQQWNIPVACYQCDDPVCMIGCPTGAITRPLGGLVVTISEATCIGCGNCVSRCPWHNIIAVPHYSPTLGRQIDLATKCDLCAGRPEGPACVQMCPHGSATRISFHDRAAVARTFVEPPDAVR